MRTIHLRGDDLGRRLDRDQEREPLARTYQRRDRLRRFFHAASWQCSGCGGFGVCTCAKEAA